MSDQPDPLPGDLTAFQRDILRILGKIGPEYGLAIKRELDEIYPGDVNHGRLYPNLDELVDRDLLLKGERDRRTNEYELTDRGQAFVTWMGREWLVVISR